MLESDYDFIIIGGGSAGCLLARRLVESACGSVALIEAGPSASDGKVDVRTVVPAFYPRTFGSSLDWAYSTEPQTGLNGRCIAWPRGKTLGGCGAINAMIYLQAADSDFDRWSAASCAGWDWQTVKQFLSSNRSSRNYCPVSDLPLAEIAEPHPWSRAFIDACNAFGIRSRHPWLQAEQEACGFYSLTQFDGRRHHTGRQLAEMRPNKSQALIRGAVVKDLKVVGGRVTAVRLIDQSGRPSELNVNGEVILCAGTVGTPSILLRSGIGPADSLRDLGIAVHHDLPGVGENLQDHLMYPLVYRTHARDGLPVRFSLLDRKRFRSRQPEVGLGPLASNIAEAGAAWRNANSVTPNPDFQVHFTPTHYLKYPSSNAPTNCFTLAVNDLHPRSRGNVELASIDPCQAPRINPRYLEHADDVPRLLNAIAVCRELANQASLRLLIEDELLPSRRRADPTSILRSVQTFAQSIYHPVGTCRMGSDPKAVVDANLRVHGFTNLHVADASVLPDLPSANTQAVTLLVAARKFVWLTNSRL